MKTKSIFNVLCLLHFIILTSIALASDLYVSTSGNDVNWYNCTNSTYPCRTIHKAIEVASDNCVIKVAQGTYNGNIEMTNSISGILIEGGWSADFSSRNDDPSNTVIAGLDMEEKAAIFIWADDYDDISVTFKNFSITGGKEGGIKVNADYGSVTAAFENNLIFENEEPYTAAGVGAAANSFHTGTANLILKNNKIYNNHGGEGSVIYARANTWLQTSVTLEKNTIFNNVTSRVIWVYCEHGTVDLMMENNIISSDPVPSYSTSLFIAGIHNSGHLLFKSKNDTMIQKATEIDVPIFSSSASNASSLELNITNSILWDDGNESTGLSNSIVVNGDCSTSLSSADVNVSFSNIGGNISNSGCFSAFNLNDSNNINANPKLNSKLHLTPGSPCIDSAVCGTYLSGTYVRIAPYSDIDGDSRPGFGSFYGCDMGADEFVPMAMPWLFFLTD